jgi:hypothetical protein
MDSLAVVVLGFVAWGRVGNSVLRIVRGVRKSVLRWCGRRRYEGRVRLERDISGLSDIGGWKEDI